MNSDKKVYSDGRIIRVSLTRKDVERQKDPYVIPVTDQKDQLDRRKIGKLPELGMGYNYNIGKVKMSPDKKIYFDYVYPDGKTISIPLTRKDVKSLLAAFPKEEYFRFCVVLDDGCTNLKIIRAETRREAFRKVFEDDLPYASVQLIENTSED